VKGKKKTGNNITDKKREINESLSNIFERVIVLIILLVNLKKQTKTTIQC